MEHIDTTAVRLEVMIHSLSVLWAPEAGKPDKIIEDA
jgi:hypothetical protein